MESDDRIKIIRFGSKWNLLWFLFLKNVYIVYVFFLNVKKEISFFYYRSLIVEIIVKEIYSNIIIIVFISVVLGIICIVVVVIIKRRKVNGL